MPADYDVEWSSADVQVVSAQSVFDVTRFGIVSKPSGARATVTVPQKNVDAGSARVTLEGVALLLEQAMKIPGVIAIYPEQDTDRSGLLSDTSVVLVGLVEPDGTVNEAVTTEVRLPTSSFSTAAGYAKGVAAPIQHGIAALANAAGEA